MHCLDLVRFDAARQQDAARPAHTHQFARQRHDRLRVDVGHHNIAGLRRDRIHRTDESGSRDCHRDRIDVAGDHSARPEQRRGAGQDPGTGPHVHHRHARIHELLQRFHAQPRALVNARPERHPRVYSDAEAAAGRRVVAPLRHQEEALPDLHGLEQLARRLHPVALLLLALARAREAFAQHVPVGRVVEEGAHGRRAQLHHPLAAQLP